MSTIGCPIEQSNLDPNDPRNSSLLRLVESIPTSSEEAHHFRLVVVDVVQRFCQDEEFDNNRRFKLLQLRHQGVSDLAKVSGDLTKVSHGTCMCVKLRIMTSKDIGKEWMDGGVL